MTINYTYSSDNHVELKFEFPAGAGIYEDQIDKGVPIDQFLNAEDQSLNEYTETLVFITDIINTLILDKIEEITEFNWKDTYTLNITLDSNPTNTFLRLLCENIEFHIQNWIRDDDDKLEIEDVKFVIRHMFGKDIWM